MKDNSEILIRQIAINFGRHGPRNTFSGGIIYHRWIFDWLNRYFRGCAFPFGLTDTSPKPNALLGV
jgi:hypothetical protein